METTYSKKIAEMICEFLNETGWKFEFYEEMGIFIVGVYIDDSEQLNTIYMQGQKLSKFNYVVQIRNTNFSVYGIPPVTMYVENKQKIANMLEFINNINYLVDNGNFEMDCQNGEIRCRSFVDCTGRLPEKDVIKNSFDSVETMLVFTFPGIMDIVFLGVTAGEALIECEHVFDRKDDC